ncbi:SpoVR family protein, partial [Bacillus cereus]
DVRDFILNNVNVYEGDESFLAGATEATKQLWDQVMDLTTKERILREMDLTSDEAIEFAKLNAGVVQPSKTSINPYYLGIKMF